MNCNNQGAKVYTGKPRSNHIIDKGKPKLISSLPAA